MLSRQFMCRCSRDDSISRCLLEVMLRLTSWTTSPVLRIFPIEMPFYAVKTGRNPGVYKTWPKCENEVRGFPKARFKKFDTEAAAWDFVNGTDINVRPEKSRYTQPTTQKENSGSSLSDVKMQLNLLTTTLVGCRVNIDQSNGRRMLSTLAQKHMQNFLGNVSQLETEARELLSVIEQEDGGNKNKRPSTSNEEHVNKKMRNESVGPFPTSSGHNEDDGVIVYTDGACFNNGKSNARAGIGVYWGPNNPMNVSERLPGRQTNNRAEIHAAVRAVQQAKEMGHSSVILRTDSQFLINSMTLWIKKWKRNGWKVATGAMVLNKDDFLEMERVSEGVSIKWEHVRGHVGIEGNEAADALANEGAAKPQTSSS